MADQISLAQRIIQARRRGVPSVMANFSRLLTSSSDSLMPVVLVAYGDTCRDDFNERMYTSWHTRAVLAEIVAQQWARTNSVNNNDIIMARLYGEIVAANFASEKNTRQDVINARASIYKILISNRPSQNTFQSAISDIVRRCKEAARNQIVTVEEALKFMDTRRPISLQTHTFYMMRGHALSSEFLKHEDARNAWINLADPLVEYVDITHINFEIIDDITPVWLEMSEGSMLAYLESKAIQNVDRCRSLIAGATFVYIVSMTKEHNLTASWISRRKQQFQSRLPGLNLDAFITEGIVRQYPRFYAIKDPTWESVYYQLAMCWSMLQSNEGLSLAWIIEQSTSSNVTCLITIADVVSRLQYFDVELLIRKGVPESNFTNACRMSLDLLRNPFCSIVRPTVNLRQYADLAYICTHIKRELMKDVVFGGYRGSAGGMCVVAESELRILATGIFNISKAKTETELTLFDQYNKTVQGYTVREIGNEVFKIPLLPRGQEDAAAADQIRELDRQTRAGWPRQARDLPHGTVMVTSEEMVAELEAHQSQRSRSFKVIMTNLYSVQTQVPLNVIPTETLDMPSPLRTISDAVSEALADWNIETPEEWKVDVPAYHPENNIGQVSPNIAKCPLRVNVNARMPIFPQAPVGRHEAPGHDDAIIRGDHDIE
ncbi:nucleoprotein [hymenopteran chu-related virus 123]|uniref:Nucleoprotein n=1 Tax=hymenopteran chu-related virus 123 TaxID=2847797 RepID=A0A7U3NUR6_9VIRU|nr:nucleoprotein [hymenopteran chu-related virus 123]QPB73965.1 nucleoprotein [hymenopteran chu-related virus 123]DAZ89731.1 TPA_asm: nucleoprotein [Dioxys cincta mononega-like virus]